MSIPRTRSSRVFTVSFPENLARQVELVAKEESRTISELFREAFRGYLVDRAHKELDKTRAEVLARHSTPYTEDDVEGFVDEIRAEMYGERMKSIAQKAS